MREKLKPVYIPIVAHHVTKQILNSSRLERRQYEQFSSPSKTHNILIILQCKIPEEKDDVPNRETAEHTLYNIAETVL